jgi:hypothetical protein
VAEHSELARREQVSWRHDTETEWTAFSSPTPESVGGKIHLPTVHMNVPPRVAKSLVVLLMRFSDAPPVVVAGLLDGEQPAWRHAGTEFSVGRLVATRWAGESLAAERASIERTTRAAAEFTSRVIAQVVDRKTIGAKNNESVVSYDGTTFP